MRPFEIYRAALYNVYGGSRVTDVPYIYKHNIIWIASVHLVYVGLAQARPNKPPWPAWGMTLQKHGT